MWKLYLVTTWIEVRGSLHKDLIDQLFTIWFYFIIIITIIIIIIIIIIVVVVVVVVVVVSDWTQFKRFWDKSKLNQNHLV